MQIVDVVFVYQLKSPELVRWHSRRHSHPHPQFELHYFLGGDARFENGADRYRVRHGSLFLTPPELVHAVVPGELHRPISYYAVLFTLDPDNPLQREVESAAFQRSFPRHIGFRHRVLFEELTSRYAHTSPDRHAAAVHMLQALLWDLVAEGRGGSGNRTPGSSAESGRSRQGGAVPAPATGTRRSPRNVGRHDYNVHVDRAVQLFERHVTEAITISEVARRLGVTPAHLTRLFDRYLGVSPLQYYRRLRMEVAASLLINTTRSVKEISFELGFANPFHFSRSFSRFAEISPSEFRREYYRNNPTGYAGKIVQDP